MIGDGSTAALVGIDGTLSWMCVPRFDAPPVFASLLDRERGGHFSVTLRDVREARQYYENDTAVLVTELRGDAGTIRITDALVFRSGVNLSEDMPAGRSELVRQVEVLDGTPSVRIEIAPFGGAETRERSGGLYLRLRERSDIELQLWSNQPLQGTHAAYDLSPGQRLELILSWGTFRHRIRPPSAGELLDQTRRRWHDWLRQYHYDGPQEALVRRSAITLKLLDYFENGALIAAPTTSLPEAIGGVRNWDYRYTWIRDAAFSVYAFRNIGMSTEAEAFLAWVLDVAEHQERPHVMYTVLGEPIPVERTEYRLRGYRDSAPVRFGNGAFEQVQHDLYGEILDCAWQWARDGENLDSWLWRRLASYVEGARRAWRTPDAGIWEVRSPGRVFTYSAALCQVALDRGVLLAERFDLPGDIDGWKRESGLIRQAIADNAWNDNIGALTQQFGGHELDASVLALPMRKVIDANHPRMIATTNAIAERLNAGNGLLYRYHPDKAPDGLPGDEGAFLLCSFWMVENLAMQGRVEEATVLYDDLCGRANHVGLLAEEIDPTTGDFLGNFPQAFSHVGVIAGGNAIRRATRAARLRGGTGGTG